MSSVPDHVKSIGVGLFSFNVLFASKTVCPILTAPVNVPVAALIEPENEPFAPDISPLKKAAPAVLM